MRTSRQHRTAAHADARVECPFIYNHGKSRTVNDIAAGRGAAAKTWRCSLDAVTCFFTLDFRIVLRPYLVELELGHKSEECEKRTSIGPN